MELQNKYIELKQKALKTYFKRMNEQQSEAVFTIKGPLLILAGAGSGKTTVLVNRIAQMIFFGDAYYTTSKQDILESDIKFLEGYVNGTENDLNRLKDIISENPVNPYNILAITFTNKAAGELKDRLEKMLGESSQGIVAATFHSACVRILRREIENIGYDKSFTIYDSDDTQKVIKNCLDELEISEKMFSPRMLQSEISRQKDQMITCKAYEAAAAGDYRKLVISKVYTMYQTKLKSANALDFDDIICLTVKLFEENPQVLSHYQNLFKYILVDEYQDTNMVQYKLVSMLSSKHGNLCVVGDDDQSIYKFRGATIRNILSFEEDFDNAKVIRLEQNYRSTKNILAVANELISNNTGRKGKNLWTAGEEGNKVVVFKAANETGEAKFVAETILQNVKNGGKYSDNAVLYRMNAQSNVIEKALISSGISYKIFGGVKFYDRKEVKDIISYLAFINNPSDMLRFKRIINEPKRGIGSATINIIEQLSNDLKVSPLEVLENSGEYAPLSKKSKSLGDIAKMFRGFIEMSETKPLEDLFDNIIEKTGYAKMLMELGEEGKTRLENINELKSSIISYAKEADEPSLSGFLEEVALFTDIDTYDENSDYVALMTMHAAKGLEFDNVFVVGLEEGIFPGVRSMESDEDLEEERRLAYVAVTRAKKKLFMTYAVERMLFGSYNRNRLSRFIKELPEANIEHQHENYSAKTVDNVPQITSTTNISLQVQIANIKRTEAVNKKHIDFAVGDRVKHNIFGEGTVLAATKMSNDTMLEVAFDIKGTKKIMANFAKISKI